MSNDSTFLYINPLAQINENSTKKIYHYTSPNGLQAILKNSSIRFSDLEFLNDTSEYIYILEILKSASEQMKDDCFCTVKEVYDLINEKYESEEFEQIFSKEGDGEYELTSMRYYVFAPQKQRIL